MKMKALCAAAVMVALPSMAQAEANFILGVGAGYGAEYEGSDEYAVGFIPMVSASWTPDRAYSGFGLHEVSLQGPALSVDFLRLKAPAFTYTLGASIAYDGGREEDDSDDLNGMGDIDGHARAGLNFAATAENGLALNVGFDQGISEDETGALVDVGLSWGLPIAKGHFVAPSVGLTWASEDYMQQYFGVSATQAANTAFQTYTPESGIKSLQAGVSFRGPIYEGFGYMAGIEFSRLMSEAADSPLVDGVGDANQLGIMAGIFYSF